MDLVQGEEIFRRHPHLRRHARAVLDDLGRIVMRAGTAVEARVDAFGDAAFAGEEGMAQAGDGRKKRRAQHHDGLAFASWVSSLSPASEIRSGCEMPITLNIEPMPPRPESVSRFSAPSISAETSGAALAINVAARASMPSRLRKSPWVCGPCTRAPRSSAARASAWKSTWAVTSAWPGFFSGS